MPIVHACKKYEGLYDENLIVFHIMKSLKNKNTIEKNSEG